MRFPSNKIHCHTSIFRPQCGSADGTAFSFYVATCPAGQKRFGDNCFEELTGGAGAAPIAENADRCSQKGMTLWYPETREELAFVEKGMSCMPE